MASFPLLRLPQLALVEVLQCLNPFELFIFAQCSRRATNIVPLSKSNGLGIIFNSEKELGINLYYFKTEKMKKKSKIDFKCKYIDCSVKFSGNNTLTVYWSNGENGYEKLLWYLYDLYKCRIRSIRYTSQTDFVRFQEFLNRVVQKQNGIEDFGIDSFGNRESEIEPSHWKNVFDFTQTIDITEWLRIDSKIRRVPPFIYNFEKFPKRLVVSFSHWFTMNNLIQANSCASIKLFHSELVVNSLVEFLQRWEAGEFPNLEHFVCILSKDTQWNGTGLEEFVPQNLVERVKRPEEVQQEELYPKVQFQREDGKIGEYSFHGGFFFEFTVL